MSENEFDIARLTKAWSAESDRILREVLPTRRPIALLDFPYHDNFGDAAIWAGERSLLRRNGLVRRYVADVGRYSPDDLRVCVPEGPILLHGGGNFGDYWPEHQVHREQILADFPEREIVQLPQAIGFRNAAEQARVAATMGSHAHFTVLVRDRRSLQLGLEMGLRTILMPDAALNIGPITRPVTPTKRVMILARTDHESSGLRTYALEHHNATMSIEDWRLPGVWRAAWSAMKTGPRIVRRLRPGSRLRALTLASQTNVFDAMAQLMVSAAVRQLSSAEVVITDRLHAHVIATLLGIPNVVVDNNYGKVAGVFDAYTNAASSAVFAESPAMAVDLARGLLS